MSRCNTIIAAALAAAALAAPTALAQPADIHSGLSDAADAATRSDHIAARPETAGNGNISDDAAPSAQARDGSRYPTTDGSVSPAEERALAQERYYESYGKPTPPTIATRTVWTDTGDEISRLPFLSAVFGALIVGLGTGSGLHLLHVRRRYRIRPVT